MSFDPFSQQPDPNLPPARPVPPGDAYGDAGQYQEALREQVSGRVTIPGVLLVIVGLLNVLAGGVVVFRFVSVLRTPAQVFFDETAEPMKQIAQKFPEFGKELNKALADRTPEGLKQEVLVELGVIAGVTLLAALLVMFGGVRMMQMKSYGVCVFASILAAVPCISPSGCCCVGNLAGLYAVIVLLSNDVRVAFR